MLRSGGRRPKRAENCGDKWTRVEHAREEIRRQHDEERDGCGQDGDYDGERTAITAPGAVDQGPGPVAGGGRDQPGEGEEVEHVGNGDTGEGDPGAGENTLEDLVGLHDAGARSPGQPGIFGALYTHIGGDHTLGADGSPARGARDASLPLWMPVAVHGLGHERLSRPLRASSPRGIKTSSLL